jgi:hypothetical protein
VIDDSPGFPERSIPALPDTPIGNGRRVRPQTEKKKKHDDYDTEALP